MKTYKIGSVDRDFKKQDELLNASKITIPQSTLDVLTSYKTSAENSAPAPESVKGIASAKRGIISFFYDLFGWNKQSTEAAKSQEAPDSAVNPIVGRPKLAPPDEETAKRLNFYMEEIRESNKEMIAGIEEEFNANKDAKHAEAVITKWLIALINANRKNHEKGGLLAAQQVEEFQETIAEAQKRRNEIHADMAKMEKNKAFYATIAPIFQGGALVGLAITGVLAITGAATIASGGTLAPFLIAANIFMGVSTALQAGNGFMKNWNEITLEKNKGVSLEINENKGFIQFEVRVMLDKVKQATTDVTSNIEESKKVLEMQLEANQSIFK